MDKLDNVFKDQTPAKRENNLKVWKTKDFTETEIKSALVHYYEMLGYYVSPGSVNVKVNEDFNLIGSIVIQPRK